MKVQERFWAWRLKIFAVIMVGMLMLISLLKRFALASLFMLVIYVVPASAYTWNDVIIEWANQPDAPGCLYYVSKYTSGGQTGFKIWKRCNGTSLNAYSELIFSDFQYIESGTPLTVCYGSTAGNVKYYRYKKQTDRTVNCNGLRADVNQVVDISTGTFSADPCIYRHDVGSSCTALDTLMRDFFPIVDDCEYLNLQLQTNIGSWIGNSYKSLVQPTNTEFPCNECIPAGTFPDESASGFGQVQPGDTRIACYYKDITGDPAAGADSFVPPTNGGGGAGDTGQPMNQNTTTETSSTTQGGQTETTTTSTTTTTTADGTITSTTTSITNCIDADLDGKSDISGLPCSGSTTTTSTDTIDTSSGMDYSSDGSSTGSIDGGGSSSASYPSLSAPGSYTNASMPEVGDFSILFSDFFDSVQALPMFSTFTLDSMAPSGSGTSSYAIDFGRFGSPNLDLSDYSTALDIIKGFMLVLGSYLAVRVVVLKR